MKVIIAFGVWCILFVLCWPLAILAMMLAPLVWLLSIPFLLLRLLLQAGFALLRAILFLPARLLSIG